MSKSEARYEHTVRVDVLITVDSPVPLQVGKAEKAVLRLLGERLEGLIGYSLARPSESAAQAGCITRAVAPAATPVEKESEVQPAGSDTDLPEPLGFVELREPEAAQPPPAPTAVAAGLGPFGPCVDCGCLVAGYASAARLCKRCADEANPRAAVERAAQELLAAVRKVK